MQTRREFLKTTGATMLIAGTGSLASHLAQAAVGGLPPELAEGAREPAVLEALFGKLPLIKKTYRPPNFETPVEYFRNVITPNNIFFVRYHVASIPKVDAAQWRLKIGGDAMATPFELTFEELRHNFDPVELIALCLCSGNRRGLFQPHVPGVQWGRGRWAMRAGKECA